MEIALHHLEAFREALAHYKIAPAAQKLLTETRLVTLAGPAGSGRDTIIHRLIQTDHYYPIVTDTTRPPRINNGIPERDGVDYFFRNEEAMLREVREGRFIEAAIIHNQQVSGISVREVERAHALGKIAITDIDTVGVETILRAKPDTVAIFLLPPSFEIWLERLKRRNPGMSQDELRRRLSSAHREFTMGLAQPAYQFVINDDLQQAVADVDAIAQGYAAGNRAADARNIAQSLLAKVEISLGA